MARDPSARRAPRRSNFEEDGGSSPIPLVDPLQHRLAKRGMPPEILAGTAEEVAQAAFAALRAPGSDADAVLAVVDAESTEWSGMDSPSPSETTDP